MKMFRVRLTRNGDDVGTFVLPAFDTGDAVARAKATALEGRREGLCDNPFVDAEGLEAWVAWLS